MNRDTNYQLAKDRVKVGWFTERGHDITGLIHVGANDGYEVQWYRQMGIAPVLCFEPLPEACARFRRSYGDDLQVELCPYALGNSVGKPTLHITPGDGQGSTFLRSINPQEGYETSYSIGYPMFPFYNLGIDVAPYNCLVVDVQGMELQVLQGFGDLLSRFTMLNVECSRVPLYWGEAPAAEVIRYLVRLGFVQQTPTEDHNDILFLHTRVL